MSDAAEAIGDDEGLPMQVKKFFTPKVAGPIAHKVLYAAFVLVGLIFFFSGLSDAFGSATKTTVSVETTYAPERVLPAIFFCAPKHILGEKWYGDVLYAKPEGQEWWGRACGDPDEGDPAKGVVRKRDMLLPPCDDSGLVDGGQFDVTGLGPDVLAMGSMLDGALGGGSFEDLFTGGGDACAARCPAPCQNADGTTVNQDGSIPGGAAACQDCADCNQEQTEGKLNDLADNLGGQMGGLPGGIPGGGDDGPDCGAICAAGKGGAGCGPADAQNPLCADCAACHQGGRRLQMVQIESENQKFCKQGFAMSYNGMAPKATTGTCIKASRDSPTVEKVEKYFGKTMMCWVLNEDGKIKSSSTSPSQLKFGLTSKKMIGDFLAYGIVGFYDQDGGAFNDAGNLIAKYYQVGLQNVVNMFGLSVDYHEDQTGIQAWSGAPDKGSGVVTADWRGSVTTMTARQNVAEYFESTQVFYIDDFTTRTSYTRGASVSEVCNSLGGAFALAMCIIGLAFRDEMAKVGDGPKYPVRVFRFQDRKSSKMEAEVFLKKFLGKAANAIAGGALNGDMDLEGAGSAVKSSAIKAGKVDQAQAAVATGAMIVPTA